MAKNETIKNEDIWQKDKLGIKQHVKSFANILKQEKYVENGTSKVYSISAEFGVGKTFFCERLADILEQDGIPVSMLNIWKMDFYDNPLIPLLIKLQDVYIKNNKFRIWVSNKLKFSINITTWLFKRFLKYFGFNIDKIIRLYKQLKPSKSKLYNSYLEYEAQLHKTKNFLSAWAKRINKPIIIIIDELDRCRPDYAVKTLETLKHFFDIPGFVFVLAIDEVQLKSSVETLYGTKNFDGYKRKFINNSFVLPKPDKAKFTEYLYSRSDMPNIIQRIQENKKDLLFKIRRDKYRDYINQTFFGENLNEFIKQADTYNQHQTCENVIINYFTYYSIWFKFNLRQMEQIFDRLVLFSKHIASINEFYSPDLVTLLVCLHEFNIQVYNHLKTNDFIYGQYGGVLHKIFSKNDKKSYAYSVFGENADKKFEDTKKEAIIPVIPNLQGFSSIYSETTHKNMGTLVIRDNVDRFFKVCVNQQSPLEWIVDYDNMGNKNPIDNNGRIAISIKLNREPKWVEPEPNIDTASAFDLEHFRHSYFENMEFISNFS